MLLVLLILALLLSLVVSYLPRPAHLRPRRCRCGRPADVFDHDQPWKVWCGRCYLKKEGQL